MISHAAQRNFGEENLNKMIKLEFFPERNLDVDLVSCISTSVEPVDDMNVNTNFCSAL